EHYANAHRRIEAAATLASLASIDAESDVRRALAAPAYLIDLGRCVDFYGRHRHTESLLLARGLAGWSHRGLALICALVRQADHEGYTPSAYHPLIQRTDRIALSAAGTILALADETERRLGP